MKNNLNDLLKYHVTGAIERGEASAIECQPIKDCQPLKNHIKVFITNFGWVDHFPSMLPQSSAIFIGQRFPLEIFIKEVIPSKLWAVIIEHNANEIEIQRFKHLPNARNYIKDLLIPKKKEKSK